MDSEIYKAFQDLAKALGVSEIRVQTKQGCFEVIVESLATNQCKTCDGSGFMLQKTKRKPRKLPCKKCLGSGKVNS